MYSSLRRESDYGSFDLIGLLRQEYVPDLRERGHNDFWARCPLPGHYDPNPSFHIDAQTGRWYCFGCSEGGSVSVLISRIEHVSAYEAWAFLRGLGFQESQSSEDRALSPGDILLGSVDKEIGYWSKKYRAGLDSFRRLVRKRGRRWAARERWYKLSSLCDGALEQLEEERVALSYRLKLGKI